MPRKSGSDTTRVCALSSARAVLGPPRRRPHWPRLRHTPPAHALAYPVLRTYAQLVGKLRPTLPAKPRYAPGSRAHLHRRASGRDSLSPTSAPAYTQILGHTPPPCALVPPRRLARQDAAPPRRRCPTAVCAGLDSATHTPPARCIRTCEFRAHGAGGRDAAGSGTARARVIRQNSGRKRRDSDSEMGPESGRGLEVRCPARGRGEVCG
ncbi:hypothetical protein C8R47DRAFT_216948 [Mycena vitilis]|nr:hypothetical protein C8R47DRAFT_216948 [Mycena vitilis]